MSISRSEVINKVNELMSESFEIPIEKLVPEAKLYEDLSLDSLDAVDMLVHLEDNLGVKVEGERFMHVRTLDDVYEVIAQVVQEAADGTAAGVANIASALNHNTAPSEKVGNLKDPLGKPSQAELG